MTMYQEEKNSGRRTNRPATFLPAGVELKEGTGELAININWWKAGSRAANRFILLFTLIWNGVLIPFVLVLIATGDLIFLLFLSLHLLVGVGMGYYLLSRLLNKTEIRVNRQKISSVYGPVKLPFKKPIDLPSYRIKQLFIKEKEAGRVNGAPQYSYDLMVIQKPGKEIKLVASMDRMTQQYLEQEIEKFLHLEDQAVDGETL